MQYRSPNIPNSSIKVTESKENLLDLFLSYIKKPYYDMEFSKKSNFAKFVDIVYFISFAIVLSFVLGFVVAKVMQMVGYDTTQNSVVDLFEETPIYFFTFLALLWAPLFEEITFRLGLKYSPTKLSISLTFIIATAFFTLLDFVPYLSDSFESILDKYPVINILLVMVFTVVVIALSIRMALIRYVSEDNMLNLYRKYFPVIFYTMALLFGAIHLLNYRNFSEIWYVSFFLFLPQLSASFILGFVRMRYGIQWSVFTHFLYNSFFTLPFVLLSLLPESFLEADLEKNPKILDNLPDNELAMIGLVSIIVILMFAFVVVAFLRLVYLFFKRKRVNRASKS